MTEVDATERVRRVWDRQAERFDREMAFWERILFEGDREWACAQARGDVLEIAVGTGRNLAHYPTGIRLTAVDLSGEMLARARTRASELGLEVDLRRADAQRLPFDDRSFDTVVCTFSLCSIPDDRAAVAEVARVLRPGGHAVLVEHVGSPSRGVRAVQWLIHQVTYRVAMEHMLRRPRLAIAAAGLEPVHLERRKAGIVDRIVARRSAAATDREAT